MTQGPRYTALVDRLPASVPFVGPETAERERGRPFKARIGANESVFGPSPKAIEAMAREASETWKYGDSLSYDLRMALADRLGVGAGNIIVGEGIDGLLGYLVRLVVGEGDKVVTSFGAYPTFNYHVTGFGGELVTVPYRDDHEDPEALIAKAGEVGAKLVYIANPDNPMGTWHDAATIQRMIDAVPDGTLLVLDEAYLEFAPEGTAPAIDPDDARVIRMRTFSKAYGMAGARVGYAIGAEPLITAFNKIRNHFGMARISQAGALAALHDDAWLAQVQGKVSARRSRRVARPPCRDRARERAHVASLRHQFRRHRLRRGRRFRAQGSGRTGRPRHLRPDALRRARGSLRPCVGRPPRGYGRFRRGLAAGPRRRPRLALLRFFRRASPAPAAYPWTFSPLPWVWPIRRPRRSRRAFRHGTRSPTPPHGPPPRAS